MTKLRFRNRTYQNRYRKIAAEWRECEACPLAEHRTNVVLIRGSIPADVLFVGEAPGRSEDLIGYPFVGPAGHYLQEIVEQLALPVRYAIANIVGCLPLDDDDRIRSPKKAEAKRCRPRLEALIRLTKPKLLATLGRTAKTHLPDTGIPQVDLIHPAAILRMDNLHKADLEEKRFRLSLTAAIERACR